MPACGALACATCAIACGTLMSAAIWSIVHQRSRTATTVAAAKTIATNAVPISCSPPWKTSVAGTSIAPMRPKPATISSDQASETARPTDAIAPAATSATGFEIRSYSETAASSVA